MQLRLDKVLDSYKSMLKPSRGHGFAARWLQRCGRNAFSLAGTIFLTIFASIKWISRSKNAFSLRQDNKKLSKLWKNTLYPKYWWQGRLSIWKQSETRRSRLKFIKPCLIQVRRVNLKELVYFTILLRKLPTLFPYISSDGGISKPNQSNMNVQTSFTSKEAQNTYLNRVLIS